QPGLLPRFELRELLPGSRLHHSLILAGGLTIPKPAFSPAQRRLRAPRQARDAALAGASLRRPAGAGGAQGPPDRRPQRWRRVPGADDRREPELRRLGAAAV